MCLNYVVNILHQSLRSEPLSLCRDNTVYTRSILIKLESLLPIQNPLENSQVPTRIQSTARLASFPSIPE